MVGCCACAGIGGCTNVGCVDRMCCRGCAVCPRRVSSASGQYLATSVGVSPGQDEYAPRFIAASHVDLTGYPAVACRYAMRCGTLGRSYARACAVVRVGCCCVAVGMFVGGSACAIRGGGEGGVLVTRPMGLLLSLSSSIGMMFGRGVTCAVTICAWGGAALGVMSMRHSRAPVVSREPLRMSAPVLSWTRR